MKRRHVDVASACRRLSADTAQTIHLRTRKVDVVYSDMFLDTFNYVEELLALGDCLISGSGSITGNISKTLLILSKPIYDTVRENENDDVIYSGRCRITPPSQFSVYANRGLDPLEEEHEMYDRLVFFNVDPFTASQTPTSNRDPSTVPATLTAGVSNPFRATFDRYMNDPSIADRTSVTLVYNTFLLRTESVLDYEGRCGVRIDFSTSALPIHDFGSDTILQTACNFCTDALLCLQSHLHTYTVESGKPIPSHRTLGSSAAETLLQSDRLVLLDVTADRGGLSTPTEYYRFKQFYYSFGHGRANKWGLRMGANQALRIHLNAWNLMMKEELRRWYWISTRSTAPIDESMRRTLTAVYAMCPCVLNPETLNSSSGGGSTNATTDLSGTLSLTVVGNTCDYLTTKFDTSTFNIEYNPADYGTLFTSNVSLNNVMVMTNGWPTSSVSLCHNVYFNAMIA